MTITITGGMTFTGGVSATVGNPITANFLVVAGGAGGGGAGPSSGRGAGGGGAGGFRTSAGTSGGGASAESTITLSSGSTYTVTVGAGGAGGGSQGTKGTNGSDSTFVTITSTGGGGGGTASGVLTQGSTGGSGGGTADAVSGTVAGGSGTANQGYAGGLNTGNGSGTNGTGGGGAGGVGTANSGTSPDNTQVAGGAGVASSITGSSVTYAVGGAGGATNNNAGAATGGANLGTGGGGGSGGPSASIGGAGGAGIVIVSYSGAPQFSGGVITSSGGNTIHTFYTSGTLQSGAALITNSLRFRSSASAYLTRTPTSTGNTQKLTWSGWVKYSTSSTYSVLFTAQNAAATDQDAIYIDNTTQQLVMRIDAATSNPTFYTNMVFRDPAAWYHIVVSIDTTQSVSTDRVKCYVNGNLVTFASYNAPAQNLNFTGWNVANRRQFVGTQAQSYPAFTWNGYMTNINFIDGQQLTPSSFGATNATTGVWQPTSYTGTYGTNGFSLPFTNTTSTTALGYDTSGNSNNYTPTNFSLTSGVTYDSVTDVPTLTGPTVSNYCVYNPLNNNGTISNGSLRFSNTAGSYASCSGTMGMSNGRYYWEVTITAYSPSGTLVGITASTEQWTGVASYIGSTTGSYGYYNGGTKYNNAASATYGSSWTTGDVIGVTYDTSTGTLTFYKNNVSQGTAYSGLTGTFMPGVSAYNNGTPLLDANFGQQPFVYTPPLGYVALNAYNM
jgi:hypothetical protein